MTRKQPIPSTARVATTTLVAVALALSATGCGGANRSTAGGADVSSSSGSTLDFSRCMRLRGVPTFPDPGSDGDLPKRQVAELAASDPQFVGAHRACEHLLPNGGQPTQAQVQQAWNDMRRFAVCLRSHGVANWPDPTATSAQDRRPFFHTPPGIDPDAPEVAAKVRACHGTLHASNPLVTTQ